MSESRLARILKAGHFAFTGELGPPRGSNVEAVREKAKPLIGMVDSVNITDNQTAMVRMSSWAAALIALQEGLEPNYQMVCRDRNRLAMQADVLGAYAHGIVNMLCLSGDHQQFGDHPNAKGVYDIDSIQLIDMVRKMRDEGLFLGGAKIDAGHVDLLARCHTVAARQTHCRKNAGLDGLASIVQCFSQALHREIRARMEVQLELGIPKVDLLQRHAPRLSPGLQHRCV